MMKKTNLTCHKRELQGHGTVRDVPLKLSSRLLKTVRWRLWAEGHSIHELLQHQKYDHQWTVCRFCPPLKRSMLCIWCGRACNFWSWVPVVAPHVGGVLGAWLYIVAIGAHLRHRDQIVDIESKWRHRRVLGVRVAETAKTDDGSVTVSLRSLTY